MVLVSGLDSESFRVIVLLNSTFLDVAKSNATAQLYAARDRLKLSFYSVSNFSQALTDTPFDAEKLKVKLSKASKSKIHHVSDIYRLVAIYKLGGWYFDIDSVIMKPLQRHFRHRNVLSSDQNVNYNPNKLWKAKDPVTGQESLGSSVANGVFHMSANQSQLLWKTMEYGAQAVELDENNIDWSSLGSIPLTRALRDLCGIKAGDFASQQVTGKPQKNSALFSLHHPL